MNPAGAFYLNYALAATLTEAGLTTEQALDLLKDTNRLDTLGSAATHGNMLLVDMNSDTGSLANTIGAVKAVEKTKTASLEKSASAEG